VLHFCDGGVQSSEFFLKPYAYVHAESQQANIPTTGCLDGVHLKMEWYAHANEYHAYCISALWLPPHYCFSESYCS
jgi:hypothetical protein